MAIMDNNTFINKYKNEFLGPEGENIDILIKKISYLLQSCYKPVKKNPESSILPISEGCIDYQKIIDSTELPLHGRSTEDTLNDVVDMLEGTQRLNSPNMAFNIAFTSPLLDTVAAMSAVALRNPSLMWDVCAGKTLAYEKKIAKIFTDLAGWNEGEGVSTLGGKESFILGIKTALTRVSPKSREHGLNDKHVVFTNQQSHFSIEHVCQYLGIGSENCIKIPCNDKGEMKIDVLFDLMEKKIKAGFKIAAIMATGGTTVNSSVDWVKDIRDTIEKIKTRHSLNYSPFLYADTALGWPFIFFAALNRKIKNPFNTDIDKKIDIVIQKMRQIKYADAYSIDFHKTAGVCPYNSGFLVFRYKEDLYQLAVPGKEYLEDNGDEENKKMIYGKVRPHNISLQNSKGPLGIATSWVALNRLGMKGIVDYIEYFIITSEHFKYLINTKYQSLFEVINHNSPYWEIVIKPYFFNNNLTWNNLVKANEEIKENYKKIINSFINYIWNKKESDGSMELFISVVQSFPTYSKCPLPALLISPTSLHYNEKNINDFLKKLADLKKEFECIYHKSNFNNISCFTPPR